MTHNDYKAYPDWPSRLAVFSFNAQWCRRSGNRFEGVAVGLGSDWWLRCIQPWASHACCLAHAHAFLIVHLGSPRGLNEESVE
jgi:hypothetical protein